MGILGRYIDSLTDEQRDRIVRAPDLYDGPYYIVPEGGRGCLLATAESTDKELEHAMEDSFLRRLERAGRFAELAEEGRPHCRFPYLCTRFGKDRIVRACKQRAARGNAPQLSEPVRENVHQEG